MKNEQKQYQEMLALRGIGTELTRMAYPRIDNLRTMLAALGYEIHSKSPQYGPSPSILGAKGPGTISGTISGTSIASTNGNTSLDFTPEGYMLLNEVK